MTPPRIMPANGGAVMAMKIGNLPQMFRPQFAQCTAAMGPLVPA